MTYKETIEFLYSCLPVYHRIGKAAYKDNLDNTQALDEYFGHPHRNFRSLHIAGTNGKGSVSHVAASVLQEAGFITGLYTSPHLKDFRERIRINGKMIPESDVVDFVRQHNKVIDLIKPSFFELGVAMAFDHFARNGVELAVIETGLGGRLDSTNIIRPMVSVITNIGHDHFDLLGGSIRNVALEKAGIIKNGIPVVIGERSPETDDVFTTIAGDTGSSIFFTEDDYECLLSDKYLSPGLRTFTIRNKRRGYEMEGSLPLGGDYQAKNIQTVFGLFDVAGNEINIEESIILTGIRKVVINTGLQGRWQVLRENPVVICDTAHNQEGLGYVFKQLGRMKYNRLHIVAGFVSDKDLAGILPLFPKDAVYYFTRAAIERALDEKILAEKAAGYGLKGLSYPLAGEALRAAMENTVTDDLIFIGGSTFIVAELI
jgi:dihydrofolate synthase/folylpolyglutamate synthase